MLGTYGSFGGCNSFKIAILSSLFMATGVSLMARATAVLKLFSSAASWALCWICDDERIRISVCVLETTERESVYRASNCPERKRLMRWWMSLVRD